MVDRTLESPVQISMRKSQIKFESNDRTFNVIRASTYGQGYLNRQVIMLLYSLDVPDTFFMDL